MTTTHLRKIYDTFDLEARAACEATDIDAMDLALDARNATGTMLRGHDHAAWRAAHKSRFTPTLTTPAK
jgi:hypothetical protein